MRVANCVRSGVGPRANETWRCESRRETPRWELRRVGGKWTYHYVSGDAINFGSMKPQRPAVLANNGWICPAVLTSHLVLARLSNVGGNCGRPRQACATASLYLHRDGADDHDLRGGVRFPHADRHLP